jgi:hypothetical protein
LDVRNPVGDTRDEPGSTAECEDLIVEASWVFGRNDDEQLQSQDPIRRQGSVRRRSWPGRSDRVEMRDERPPAPQPRFQTEPRRGPYELVGLERADGDAGSIRNLIEDQSVGT